MSDYIGIVPVTFDSEGIGKVYLFECKPWSSIKEGEYVMVGDCNSKFALAIADSLTISRTSNDYMWIVKVLGAKHPLKRIVGVFTPVEYKED